MKLLHSKIIGEGEPLLILHGFLGMSDNWKTLANKYSEEGFEVHLIDQRNHGKSFWSEEFNYEILATDIANYLNHLKIEQCNIIGHSMGGKTAMQFACTYPNYLQKLIVADIAPKYYPPHHQNIIDALNMLNLSEIDSRSGAASELEKHISEFGIRQFLLKNLYWVTKGELGWRFNLKVLSEKMEEIGDTIASSSIFEGPTLFLKGDKSEYVITSDEVSIKNHFPNAQIKTIDKAGHWLHAENPTQFFEKSLKFLKS
ncbi:alpha/beta fold hydrolase [Kriegella sp. EG-1]|nr:alpha/beta fold hydrolase [Flavobacteriaceae bacterium EG-1]